MNHPINSVSFTIRTEETVLAIVTGLGEACRVLEHWRGVPGVAVFFDDAPNGMRASFFRVWAKRLDSLITNAKNA